MCHSHLDHLLLARETEARLRTRAPLPVVPAAPVWGRILALLGAVGGWLAARPRAVRTEG